MCLNCELNIVDLLAVHVGLSAATELTFYQSAGTAAAFLQKDTHLFCPLDNFGYNKCTFVN